MGPPKTIEPRAVERSKLQELQGLKVDINWYIYIYSLWSICVHMVDIWLIYVWYMVDICLICMYVYIYIYVWYIWLILIELDRTSQCGSNTHYAPINTWQTGGPSKSHGFVERMALCSPVASSSHKNFRLEVTKKILSWQGAGVSWPKIGNGI